MNKPCRQRQRLKVLAFFVCTSFLYPAYADESAGKTRKTQALESVRTEIDQVESGIRNAKDESEKLYKELEQLEANHLDAKEKLLVLNQALSGSDDRLTQLSVEEKLATEKVDLAREKLSKQLRATYITGRHNILKLVLNQENPAQLSRLIAYHHYFNQARGQQIAAIDASLLNMANLKQQITLENKANRDIRQAQESKLQEIATLQASRHDLLKQLNQYIADQDNHLQTLRQTEAELTTLLNELANAESASDSFAHITPFSSLQGKLNRPVSGKVDISYGEYKKGGRMRAMGVTFLTKTDADVKAVADGRVIFADWFRNLGLLLIIDHGNGYMSLYGYNAAISKKKGDWVEAGESISTAGDTGGHHNTSLYFEIRKNGTPLNPLQWCKR